MHTCVCVCVSVLCSGMSRVTAAWVPIIRATLRCLKDLQNGLHDYATHAICSTEAAKLIHAAKATHGPQERLIKLHEVAAVAEIEFYGDMLASNVTSHKYKRHAGIVILSSFLQRGVSRAGSMSYIPLAAVELGCKERADQSIPLCLVSHKSEKSYGAMYHEYSREHKPLFQWYLAEVRPLLCADKTITWESTDMLFPSEPAVTSLMDHFWRTSSVVARSARISLSEARSLMCRDVQTLVNDPLFGGDVKELQMAAGTP